MWPLSVITFNNNNDRKGSHFLVSHFFEQNWECRDLYSRQKSTCLCLPQTRGHTSHVALFWVKFPPSTVVMIIYVRSNFKKCNDWKGSHFVRRTFLSKISTYIYSCEGLVSQLDHTCLCPPQTRGHTLCVALFYQNLYLFIVVKVWSVNWTITVSVFAIYGVTLHMSHFLQ